MNKKNIVFFGVILDGYFWVNFIIIINQYLFVFFQYQKCYVGHVLL